MTEPIKPKFGDVDQIEMIKRESEILQKRDSMQVEEVRVERKSDECDQCGGEGVVEYFEAICPHCKNEETSFSDQSAFDDLAELDPDKKGYHCRFCKGPLEQEI